jgi:hypothetical protein
MAQKLRNFHHGCPRSFALPPHPQHFGADFSALPSTVIDAEGKIRMFRTSDRCLKPVPSFLIAFARRQYA